MRCKPNRRHTWQEQGVLEKGGYTLRWWFSPSFQLSLSILTCQGATKSRKQFLWQQGIETRCVVTEKHGKHQPFKKKNEIKHSKMFEHISETYPKFLKFPLHEKNRFINHRWGSIRIFLDAYFVRPRLGLRMDPHQKLAQYPTSAPQSHEAKQDRSAWEHAMLWTFKAGQHVYPVAEQPMLQHIKTNPPFQKIKPQQSMLSKHQFQMARTTGILNWSGSAKLESCLKEPSQGYQPSIPDVYKHSLILQNDTKCCLNLNQPPLLQNVFGVFDGGSKANVGHYKMVTQTGCSEKSWFSTKSFLEISL